MKAYKKTLIHCQILLIFVVHTAVTLNETTTVNDQLPKTNNSSSSNNIKTDNNGGASERSDTKVAEPWPGTVFLPSLMPVQWRLVPSLLIDLNGKKGGLNTLLQKIVNNLTPASGHAALKGNSSNSSTTSTQHRMMMHRRRNSTAASGSKRPSKCKKLTEREKYLRLENIGGRNQQFMANSPDEAGRNFPVIMVNFNDVPFFDGVDVEHEGTIHDHCGSQCMEIKFKLSDALQNRNRLMNPMDFLIHDLFYDSPVYHEPQQQHHHQKTVNVVASPRNRMASRSGDEPISKGSETSSSRTMGLQRTIKTKTRGKTGCFLEEFIPIGNCTSHGQEEDRGIEKLCTTCQGVYIMNKNCFPKFINAVVCDRLENDCIFDRFSGNAQGRCREKTLSFKVIRNKGTEECEEWIFEYLEVPVACECYLSKDSIFLEAIPPPPEPVSVVPFSEARKT